MTKQPRFIDELKALGQEIVKALSEARTSKEYKNLEREIVSSVKSVGSELKKSLSAAQKSQATGRIKKRFKKVVKTGKEDAQVAVGNLRKKIKK